MQNKIYVLKYPALLISCIVIASSGLLNYFTLPWYFNIFLAILQLLILASLYYCICQRFNKLRHKEQLAFKTIVDNAKLSIWSVDIPNNTLSYNVFLSQILGLPADTDSLSILTLVEHCHPEDRENLIRNYSDLASGKERLYNIEYRVQHSEGHWFWIKNIGNIIERNSNGQALCATGITINLDDHDGFNQVKSSYAKQMEHILETKTQYRAKLEMIIESVELAIWEIDLTANTIHLNKYFSKTLGLPFTEHTLSMDEYFKLCHEDERGQLIKTHTRVTEGKVFLDSLDYRIQHQDGHYIWIHNIGRIFEYDENKIPLQSIGITVDIQKQKEEELNKANYAKVLEEQVRERTEELSQERSLLQSILENIPDAIFYQNTEGFYLGCNRAHANMRGLNPSKIIGKHTSEVIKDPAIATAYILEDQNIIAQRNLTVQEEQHILPNGQAIILETIKTVFTNPQGDVLGLLGISRNITQRKHLEAEITKAQANALAASEAKSTFLANMSHEIRTPMNGILGLTHLALACELSPKVIKYLDKINYSAKNLLTIINEILDFSKVESGKMILELNNFSLQQTLEDLQSILERDLTQKNLYFKIIVDPNLPQDLCGDALRLNQILLNLTSNALKFTETGGIEITISLKNYDDLQMELLFCIADTGIGIVPEYLDHIFSSFSQADTSITRKYGGTGLGLAITKKLVELMQGKITVQSIPGKGTTFRFTARFYPAIDTPISPPPAISTVPFAGQARILVAEDNEINQLITSEILEGYGFLVDIANNGLEALELAKTNTYAAILMDIQMPKMDGLEATKKIRQIPSLQQIPIIAMTAHAMASDMQKSLDAGMNSHVTKPITPEILLSTICELIGMPAPENLTPALKY